MTSNDRLFFGFFLARLPGMEEGQIQVKVACIQPEKKSREVFILLTDDIVDKPYGALVHFHMIDDELKNNTSVRFLELKDSKARMFFKHETRMTQEIVHTAQNLDVGADDLPALGIYLHPDLGEIDDPTGIMKPGHYRSMTFEVRLDDDGKTFNFIIHQGAQGEESTEVIEENFEEKAKQIPNFIEIERNHFIQESKAAYDAIGLLKLIKYNDKDLFSGIRPVLKLCDQSRSNLLSMKWDVSPIVMIKMIEKDGKWIDDSAFEPQLGTLFPGSRNDRCIVKLKMSSANRFERTFNLDDVFRLEASDEDKESQFWKAQKQKNSEIYQLTLEKEPESLLLQDVLDEHMMEPEILKKTVDSSFTISKLNESQRKAVLMALNEKRKLVCIQGPPGTGKTLVLATVIKEYILKKKQVVVMAPTREALQNILEMTRKVLSKGTKKYHENVLLDIITHSSILEKSEEAKQGKLLVDALKEKLERNEITEQDYICEKSNIIHKIRCKKNEEIMKDVRAVFCTVSSSFADSVMKCSAFNPGVCILDEAGQIKECTMWPAVMKMQRIVLAGDPKQLPGLVLTEEAKKFGLQNSIMDRIIDMRDHFSWVMLDTQYRSHEAITLWSSVHFYQKQIKNKGSSLTMHASLKPTPPKKFWNIYDPLVMIDTSMVTDVVKRIETYEQVVYNNTETNKKGGHHTYSNEAEAKIAMEHYKQLISMSIQPQDIAIISPYKGQTDLISGMMEEFAKQEDIDCSSTTIGTVDSVQGKEYDVVIFSMVRSNPRKTIGFVGDLRRLNVVITRAKRHFLFIGNGFLLSQQFVREICDLFHLFLVTQRRFHPDNVFRIETVPNNDVKNNYGFNFEDFAAHTQDEEMKTWCKEFVRKANDPVFRQKRFNNYKARNGQNT